LFFFCTDTDDIPSSEKILIRALKSKENINNTFKLCAVLQSQVYDYTTLHPANLSTARKPLLKSNNVLYSAVNEWAFQDAGELRAETGLRNAYTCLPWSPS
jgi:hypothetical protein